jgi:small subunit ribosomal protein S6
LELSKFDEKIKSIGGDIEKLERQGKKKLGFNIKKHNDGYFVLAYVTLDVDKVEKLKENCKYSDNILRYFVTRKEAA